jgi:hypothetical protein
LTPFVALEFHILSQGKSINPLSTHLSPKIDPEDNPFASFAKISLVTAPITSTIKQIMPLAIDMSRTYSLNYGRLMKNSNIFG